MRDVFQDVSKSQVLCVKVFKYCVPCSFVEMQFSSNII